MVARGAASAGWSGSRVGAGRIVGALAALLAATLAVAGTPASPAADVAAGERLYRTGQLPDGSAVHAVRENQTLVQGATAACVNCHRRSGLGNVEGNYVVPPVTAKYLMRSAAENNGDLEMAHVAGYHQGHVPYTDELLARAVREGMASDGHALSGLMPRYDLDASTMADLTAYLHGLGQGPFPGVSDGALQFATIVTPDADPVERQAMLDVLQTFFKIQSEVIAAETRPLVSTHEIKYRVTRQWHLHVWELTGPAPSWQAQLEAHMAAEPVFAILSGIGRSDWAPVHRFCESAKVPCLFPNIDLPLVDENNFYPVYFSRGVLLEADLLARWLGDQPGASPTGRVVQVFRAGDVGAAAARALQADLRAAGRDAELREVPAAAGPDGVAAAFRGLGAGDTLVLWLRGPDLAALPAQPPPGGLLLSGLMGGMESAPLPAAWRAAARLAYIYDLPERRMARMNFPYGWFRVQHIPLVAERVQVNTYLACVVAAETLGHMLDSFVPDYFIERLEMMVSRRLANAYFPRLGLAPGQRFASKGGYIVHFDTSGRQAQLPATADRRQSQAYPVIADTEWTVP